MTDLTSAPLRETSKDLRSFGLTFATVAGAAAAFLLWRGRTAPGQIFLAVAAAFLIVGALIPTLLRPFFGPWMKFAEILGFINTRILLGVFFFIGVTPTGLLMRLSGKDPMNRSFKRRGSTSYWTRPEPHVNGRRHFDRQF